LLTLSHLATVRGKQNIVGQRFVEFEMEPFKVDLQALMAAKGNGVQWKKGLGHKLEARIGISHKDSEKANKLVDFLKPKLPALQSTKFDMATALDAAPLFGRWGGFLSVPYTGQMLPLLRRTGEQMMQFDHQIDLDLSYKRMGKTPLAVYNQSSKRQRTSHLPSPVSETMPPKQVAEVKWRVVKGIASNSTTRADTSCLFCGDTVFPTVARLHHHLKTNHENNKFEVKEKETQRGAEVVNEVTIDFEVSKTSDNARASDSVPDARAVTWVAPKEPFNETEYNAGNEDWVAKGSYEGKRKAHSKTAAKSVIIKPKSPSKIAKLPVANRKKHKVPRGPPGVTFFRTLSKRALDEGEYVSESDDDIDITWLKLRRDGETSDSDTPESAKAFIKKIDDYMEDERLTDDLHVGDALVRFANKNREWLQQSWAAKELLRKAAELRSDDIISEAVLQHCIDFVGGIEAASNENSLQPRKVGVHSTPPRTPTTPSPSNSVNGNAGLGSNKSRNRTLGDGGWDVPAQAGSLKPKESKSRGCRASNLRDRDGDIEMTERSPPDSRQPSDDSAAPEKPPYDTCFCGNNPETASRLRDVVWCANDVSFSVRIHLCLFPRCLRILITCISPLHSMTLDSTDSDPARAFSLVSH
jgi:hypothetical protein